MVFGDPPPFSLHSTFVHPGFAQPVFIRFSLQECVCPERCRLLLCIPCRFLSVFLFGRQPPPRATSSRRLLRLHLLARLGLISTLSVFVLSRFIAVTDSEPSPNVGPSLILRIPQTEESRNTVKVPFRNLEVTGTSLWFGNIFCLFTVSYVMPVQFLMSSGVGDGAWKTVAPVPDVSTSAAAVRPRPEANLAFLFGSQAVFAAMKCSFLSCACLKFVFAAAELLLGP